MEFFATSNGIPVHISDTGKGDKVILLLHGYLETLNVWEEFQVALLEAYKDSSEIVPRIISLDLPGHGLSGSLAECNSMEYCADVVKGVLDLCGVSSCAVIGHSFGGYVGQVFLRKFPDFVESLILLSSVSYPDDPSKHDDRAKEVFFIQNGKLLQLASLVIPNMFAKQNLRAMDRNIQSILVNCETHDPDGIAATVKGIMVREDMTPFLASCLKPLALIYGTEDHYFSAQAYKDMIKSIGHISVLETDCGHDVFLENPKLTAGWIADFTKENC